MCRPRSSFRSSTAWSRRAISRHGSLFDHTAAGKREAQVISRAWGTWLAERVEQDIGRPSGTDLRAAVDSIAKRLLAEDLTTGLPTRTSELEPAPAG